MKIKMVKMGSDYTTPINCRLRGIVVTSDNKHLSVEIGCAYSPDIRHTSLTQKEYNIKYPKFSLSKESDLLALILSWFPTE